MKREMDLMIDRDSMPIFTKKEFLLFRDFISKRSGIYFDEGMMSVLKAGLDARLLQRNLRDYYGYYNFLNSVVGEEEFKELLDHITINETKFFRHTEHFNVLREKVLPELIHKKMNNAKQIRIWSAGCSTGEEAYSIAMTVKDVLPLTEGWQIYILGTDASKRSLEAAKEAVYGKRALSLVDEEHFKRYFEPYDEGRYRVKENIRNMVKFSCFNLIEEMYPGAIIGGWDIIFCRNVTIYFNIELTKKIIEKFYNNLVDDGCFFIGGSEILPSVNVKFSTVKEGGIFYYQKKQERKATLDKEKIFGDYQDKKDDEIEKFDSERYCNEALFLYEKGFLEESLRALDEAKKHSEDASLYLAAANILFDEQKYDRAEKECLEGLKHDPLSYYIHFLLGAIHQKNNASDKAVEEFRKSIYLEKEFMWAYLAMATVYIENNQPEFAMREINNAVWASEQVSKRNWVNINKNILCDLTAKVCKFLVAEKM